MVVSDGSSHIEVASCSGGRLTLSELWRIYRHALRSSDRYARIRSRRLVAMVDGQFCEPDQFADVALDLDRQMAGGQIMKDVHNSRSTGVARVSLLGWDVMVKRYNHKGLAHSAGRTIEGSRAKWSWFRSHVLRAVDIASPRPLAFVDICQGPLVWKSYMLYEYVAAQGLNEVLKTDRMGTDELTDTARKVHTLLSSLWGRRITHGDLKLQNILLGSETATLIDIDQMQVHLSERLFRSAYKKDLTTLRRYLRPYPQFETILAGFESEASWFGPAAE